MLNETEYAELENVTIDFVAMDNPKSDNPLKRRESKIIYNAIMKSECKNPEILHSQINAAFKTTQSKLNFFDAQKLKSHKISLKAITETYMMLNKKPKVSYAANLASKLGKQAKASRNRILSIMGQGRGSSGWDSLGS